MPELKTYSIATDITTGILDTDGLKTSIANSGNVADFDFLFVIGDALTIIGGAILDETALDTLVSEHVANSPFEIYSDVVTSMLGKEATAINYKTELKDGISYTPEFLVHKEAGDTMGLLDKTNYYRDFIDDEDKGTLVMQITEVYVMEPSAGVPPSSVGPLTRDKTWSHARLDGSIDTLETKTRPKKYNTRRKRHTVGINKRTNIIEQLIDNVGLAGVLSGIFADKNEANSKLTDLVILYSGQFTGYKQSGLDGTGTIYDVILNDSTTTWLTTVIPDNGTTQTMIPWMIGSDFRSYIISKLKADIK